MFNMLKLSNFSRVIVGLISLFISAGFENDLSPIATLTGVGRKKLITATVSETYFTSVYPTAMWLQCNRPITGAEGSYKANHA